MSRTRQYPSVPSTLPLPGLCPPVPAGEVLILPQALRIAGIDTRGDGRR